MRSWVDPFFQLLQDWQATGRLRLLFSHQKKEGWTSKPDEILNHDSLPRGPSLVQRLHAWSNLNPVGVSIHRENPANVAKRHVPTPSHFRQSLVYWEIGMRRLLDSRSKCL